MRPIGDHGFDILGADVDLFVKCRAVICAQREPIFAGLFEFFWREFSALNIIKCRLVGPNHTAARAAFDGHITNRHPAFHAHLFEDIAAIFQRITRSAAHADFCDDMQDHVFRCDTCGQLTIDINRHCFWLRHQQALVRENMTDLRCANPKSDCAEGSVRAGMAVAANDGHAGLRRAQLWAHHMDNAAMFTLPAMGFNTVSFGICQQRFDLRLRLRRHIGPRAIGINFGRRRMINRRQRAVRTAHLKASGL